MNELIQSQPITLPAPSVPMTVRVGTRDDIPFMDALQKKHGKALGFFSRKMFEGYIDAGHVLIAQEREGEAPAEPGASSNLRGSAGASPSRSVGYCISRDRYLKRDELGAVFQLCVVPGRERGFIGANLLREVFERSSYGCRLYCCWCAQDLPANRFWEAMGFVPIAYRAGSAKKSRVHIYWQKRIRAGDNSTPYWFPAKTEGGAIREDRIILPIPPSLRWTDELPVLVAGKVETPSDQRSKRKKATAKHIDSTATRTSLRFGPPGEEPENRLSKVTTKDRSPKEKPAKTKADPVLIAKARQLRDQYLEQFNTQQGLSALMSSGKYDVSRAIKACGSIEISPTRLLEAA